MYNNSFSNLSPNNPWPTSNYVVPVITPIHVGTTLYSSEAKRLQDALAIYDLTHKISNAIYPDTSNIVIHSSSNVDPNVFEIPLVIDKKTFDDKGYTSIVSTSQNISSLSPLVPNALLVGTYDNYATPGIKNATIAYYTHKFTNSWIRNKLKYLLKYVVISNGKAEFIKNKNYDDYEKNSIEDIEKKIKFINEYIDEIDISDILHKFVKKNNLSWAALNKDYYKKALRKFIGKKIEKKLLRRISA
jgi:hypothetical protein